MDEKITDFKQLRIWQKGIEVVKDIYQITREFPKEELYGLTSQIRRAAVSIPANVAEGFKRFHAKDYKHFLNIASSSAAELETLLIISWEVDLMSEKEAGIIGEKIDHIYRMITKLTDKLV